MATAVLVRAMQQDGGKTVHPFFVKANGTRDEIGLYTSTELTRTSRLCEERDTRHFERCSTDRTLGARRSR